jgi:hypothetical protein
MYTRRFEKATHVRKFTISSKEIGGWEVSDEQDSQVIRRVSYHDWHRVERAKRAFAIEAAALQERGWSES